MSDTTTDAPANTDTSVAAAAAAAAKVGEATAATVSDQAGAQAKFSEQYLSSAQPGAAEAGKVVGKAIGPHDCDKAAALEKEGILPPGKNILHDGPNEMKERGHERGISQTETETVQVLPDGTKVITDTTTTVIPPQHDHQGFKEGFKGGMGVPAGDIQHGAGISHALPNAEGVSHPWSKAEGQAFPVAPGQYPQDFHAGIPGGGAGGAAGGGAAVMGRPGHTEGPPKAVVVPDVAVPVNQ